MKGVFTIIDGMGDLPVKQFNNLTPLESAKTPNLDWLASMGKLGKMYPVKKGVAPESDTATVSMFGNDPHYSSRGWLEAIGSKIKLVNGDLAVRTNFATIDNSGKTIIDRRAGRTLRTKEAKILGEAITKNLALPCKFIFKPTIQHRGVLVLKGKFSDNITNTDPAYNRNSKTQNHLKLSEPLDEEENTEYTTWVINEFIEQGYKILNKHPINLKRKRKGLLPANIILTRDAGVNQPNLKKMQNWAAIAYMPLEIGIAKISKMDIFSFKYPKLKGDDVYENLHSGLKKACKFAKNVLKKKYRKYNYFYIHFKETDIPGHDNKPHEKKQMLEEIDKIFFSYIVKFVKKHNTKILVTADHSTPCNLKKHSADPVPVLLYTGEKTKPTKFSERACEKGKLGVFPGEKLLEKAGFIR